VATAVITTIAALTIAAGAIVAAPPAIGADASAAPAAKWQWLFDGKINDSFRGWGSDGLPQGWHVAHGTLAKQGSVDDLVTRQQFGNFELTLEWKIGKQGNSGIFYRGTREYDHIYWSAPEYQLLDDENAPDGRNRLTAAGSAYALYAAPAGVVKPFGKWNTARIVCTGTHVEHWMNGQLVVAYDLQSADWKAKVAASKFSEYPNYGLANRGFIGIQGDHSGTLALRRIRIRELP
jgi:hypothetical protein